MKYVILKTEITPGIFKAFPLIFAEHLCHSDVALVNVSLLKTQFSGASEVYSAGFCGISEEGFVCTRGSETLGITRETERCDEDELLIEFNDSTSGIMNNIHLVAHLRKL